MVLSAFTRCIGRARGDISTGIYLVHHLFSIPGREVLRFSTFGEFLCERIGICLPAIPAGPGRRSLRARNYVYVNVEIMRVLRVSRSRLDQAEWNRIVVLCCATHPGRSIPVKLGGYATLGWSIPGLVSCDWVSRTPDATPVHSGYYSARV